MAYRERVPRVQGHVDPMRYPAVQGRYEREAMKSFAPVELFGNIVETMTRIVKEKRG